MKIIYLLNKIANGGEVPKKIKWGAHIYTWLAVEYKALDEFGEPLFSEQAGYTKYSLNDEVEILEEEKKIPEKLGFIVFNEDHATALIHNKVDEIIDYLNSKGDE